MRKDEEARLLQEGLEALDIRAEEAQQESLLQYMEAILSWNDRINLTAITDRREFIRKHLLDSLTCCSFPEFQRAGRILDVGTGAGFPGVPLALLFPEKQIVLMDSLNKRLRVIRELTATLGVSNTEVLHGRAEDLGRSPEHREQYDLCVSRAVAHLSVLAEYTLPFLRQGGALLAYKGPEGRQEITAAEAAVRILGGKPAEMREAHIPGMETDHIILVVHKIKNTPKAYPRKAGTPSKEPLR